MKKIFLVMLLLLMMIMVSSTEINTASARPAETIHGDYHDMRTYASGFIVSGYNPAPGTWWGIYKCTHSDAFILVEGMPEIGGQIGWYLTGSYFTFNDSGIPGGIVYITVKPGAVWKYTTATDLLPIYDFN